MTRDLTYARIADDKLRGATGRGWESWLQALDAAGAAEMGHADIVAYLDRAHPEVPSNWWRQTITVGYEQARGRRAVGQTAGGFQVGVQRTVPAPVEETWQLLVSRPELWLGEGAAVAFTAGERYDVPPSADGGPAASGEIRVVEPGERLRLTWHPDCFAEAARVQLTLSASASGRTALHAHVEKLPDAGVREAMREHWGAALERVVAAAG